MIKADSGTSDDDAFDFVMFFVFFRPQWISICSS